MLAYWLASTYPSPFSLILFFIHMQSSTIRIQAVKRALARVPATVLTPSEQELQLLTNYVLGHISLEEANAMLQGQGRIMVALYQDQLVTA